MRNINLLLAAALLQAYSAFAGGNVQMAQDPALAEQPTIATQPGVAAGPYASGARADTARGPINALGPNTASSARTARGASLAGAVSTASGPASAGGPAISGGPMAAGGAMPSGGPMIATGPGITSGPMQSGYANAAGGPNNAFQAGAANSPSTAGNMPANARLSGAAEMPGNGALPRSAGTGAANAREAEDARLAGRQAWDSAAAAPLTDVDNVPDNAKVVVPNANPKGKRGEAEVVLESQPYGNSQYNGPVNMPPLPTMMSPQQMRLDAYQYNRDTMFPMTPEMINEFRKFVDQQQRAKSAPPGPPPKPESRTVVVKGDPGESPAVIRLAKNFVSTLVFSDATGAPWPVKSFGVGNDEQIGAAAPDPEGAPNVLTLSTGMTYIHGNMQVILVGRTTPVVLTIVSDQHTVDYTTNIKLQSRGPNAAAPIMSSENYSVQTNPRMTAILDGIPPTGAMQLFTSDGRMEAWKMDGKYYLRTRMTMYSPAWSNHMASPEGVHAYEITPTPVIIAADNGNPQQINIGE